MRGTLAYIVYRLLGAIVGPMPPRIGYALARLSGGLLYRFYPRLRQILSQNLRHVVGPEASPAQVQFLVRQACVNIAKGHYELFRVSRLTRDQIKRELQVQGLEFVEQALASGKGAVLFSAHLGCFEAILQLPAAYGVQATAVALHTKPERLFRYACRLRGSHGLRLIPADEVVIGLFRALKRGELVLLATDRDVTDSGRMVDFFGSLTCLPDGPVRVALRTGAALIPGFAERLPDDSFQVQFQPPLALPQSGDHEADVADGMEQVVAVMEQYISRHPEQWIVAVPVWPMDAVAGPMQ